MGRRSKQAINNSSRTYFIRETVLLVAFALIKIGQLPALLLRSTLNLLKFIKYPKLPRYKAPKLKIAFPKLTLPDLHTIYSPPQTRKRGRPRTQPIVQFYRNKFNKHLKKLLPFPLRKRMALAFIIFVFITYSVSLARFTSSLPSPDHLTSNTNNLTTKIYDRNGKLLYQLYEGKNRELIKLDDLPKELVDATIAMEDKNFYSHPGVDPAGILRALDNNINNKLSFSSSKETLQGGSTITQQLIKNTLLTPDQTFTRKAKEIILALWAEMIYSKKEILQAYFNESPYGGPAWGIQAASRMYFGKDAKDLTLAESAYLAGLPAAPTLYSPYGTHPELARERQKQVLQRMVEDKYITQNQAQSAYESPLNLKPQNTDIKAPHFVMYVRSLLAQKYGEKVVSQGGLKIITTLDYNLQEKAEDIVAQNVSNLAGLNVGNGAAMITDPRNGQILVMVGSKNYFDPNGGNFNVALALRQPGSSVKPITYVEGFRQGLTPGTVILDTPISFTNPWERYSPVNYDGKFHGPVSIRTALGSSYNIPAVKTLNYVGISNMVTMAQNLGITTWDDPSQYGLSLTLGGGATKLIDMMSVYGTFASGGIKNPPQPILSITDADGNILEDHTNSEGKQALSPQLAYLISSILSDPRARIPAFGANSLLEISGHTSVAVKTGTSDDKRDNLAFGFTPEFVVGAWVGNNDNSRMDPRLTSGVTGATPIWHDLMVLLLKDRPNLSFQRPSGVKDLTIDGNKDLSIDGITPKSLGEYQKPKVADQKTN